MSDPKLSFEEAFEALEARVRKLESGEVPLDEALRLFEEGSTLARTCQEHLDSAEQRVSALTRGQAGPETRPLQEPED